MQQKQWTTTQLGEGEVDLQQILQEMGGMNRSIWCSIPLDHHSSENSHTAQDAVCE
jgi:sugar phosphate isomerase/epimerase